MDGEIRLDRAQLIYKADAPELKTWLLQEIERWLLQTHGVDMDVRFVAKADEGT